MLIGLRAGVSRARHPLVLDAHFDREGFLFTPGADLRAQLGPLADWDAFVASWNDLALDTYMADGGRYRRRRHATFRADESGIVRESHQPHFQTRHYNPLNGGVERWFEPVLDVIANGPSLSKLLALAHAEFCARSPNVHAWHVEVHQFRIEARANVPGQPTPEGVHRDGVDWVLVALVQRSNIRSGMTTVHAPDGKQLGSFTLANPLDAAWVDDTRVFHGVTAVEPLDANQPAFRDVLVVTFRSADAKR